MTDRRPGPHRIDVHAHYLAPACGAAGPTPSSARVLSHSSGTSAAGRTPAALRRWPGTAAAAAMASPRRTASLELDRRLARLRSQMRLILQAAIAASVSWELASLAFPHSSPLFAPFAAIVCLASGYGQRARRTLELILGVALGIGVADLAARATGTGWWQLFLITLAAMSVACCSTPVVCSYCRRACRR